MEGEIVSEGLPVDGNAIRAGILVTGSEIVQATIRDENGPWLSGELAELGVELLGILAVPDHRQALLSGLRHFSGRGAGLIITTGGLGPTADDLTAEVVADFSDRDMVLDRQLEEKIAVILSRFNRGGSTGFDQTALNAANRKQALIPRGAIPLDPVGTAPGLVVPPTDPDRPLVLVLPGPPRELRPMWPAALSSKPVERLLAGTPELLAKHLRMFGTPESELALALSEIESGGVSLDPLEITTCLRKGEVEIDIRFRHGAKAEASQLTEALAERFPDTLYSMDGTTIDVMVAELLKGHTLATAESCSAGLLAARLTDLPGTSSYFAGGVVSYSNAAKRDLLGVDLGLIEEKGAVSAEVAEAMARGALDRFGADLAVSITGIAGPGGGSEDKPVGLVHFHARTADGREKAAAPVIPGGRRDVRERSALVAMHLLRWLLTPE